MQFANYFFASILTYLGLLAGIILAMIAPEEQKPLKKYFIFARKFFLMIMFIFLIVYYSRNFLHILVLTACCTSMFYIQYNVKNLLKESMIIYSVFGILLFLSLKSTHLFVFESSFIFLYGLFTSSILEIKGKNYQKFLLNNSIFILIANIMFFL